MIQRTTIFTLLLVFATMAKAQNKYLPGTITLKTGEELQALIKYNNWQYTPEKMTYRLSETGAITTGSLESLNGFSVTGKATYIAADVKIDVSSNIAKQISNSREPKWENKRLFLKEIIGTGVKLYYHKARKYERFFYQKVDNDNYEQLIYKPYESVQLYKSYNRDYRKQLKDNFTCDGLKTDFRELDYRFKDIVTFFVNYNECLGYDVASVKKTRAKAQTFFSLKAGVTSFNGSFVVRPTIIGARTTESAYEASTGLSFGLDMELVLPQQNKQWSLLFGAQYENFKTNGMFREPIFFPGNTGRPVATSSGNWNINVSHIVFGLGIRRSLILGEDSRIFINAGVNSNFVIQISSFKFIGDPSAVNTGINFLRFDLTETNSLYAGFGYATKRLSIEARYGSPREVLGNIPDLISRYTSLGLIFGFQLNK